MPPPQNYRESRVIHAPDSGFRRIHEIPTYREFPPTLVFVTFCVTLLCSSLKNLGLIPFIEFPVPFGCVMSTGVSDQVNLVNSFPICFTEVH